MGCDFSQLHRHHFISFSFILKTDLHSYSILSIKKKTESFETFAKSLVMVPETNNNQCSNWVFSHYWRLKYLAVHWTCNFLNELFCTGEALKKEVIFSLLVMCLKWTGLSVVPWTKRKSELNSDSNHVGCFLNLQKICPSNTYTIFKIIHHWKQCLHFL